MEKTKDAKKSSTGRVTVDNARIDQGAVGGDAHDRSSADAPRGLVVSIKYIFQLTAEAANI